jgi:probable rRNA maturation factor
LNLLRRAARHALVAEGFNSGDVSIVVVGARAMATLHERYLDIPGPTDVLTFDLGTNRGRGPIDGEIIVCADVAARTARRAGSARLPGDKTARQLARAARAELALYVVHGVLHLAGYDDRTPRGFARMHRREDELLRELGLGPVFAAEGEGKAPL